MTKAEQQELPARVPEQEAVVGRVVPANGGGLYDLIVRGVNDQGCDPAKLRELLAVRREWNADEAAAAFNAAVVLFQQKCAIVGKLDQANGRSYARLDRIWRTVRPLMEECGLAVTWESMVVDGGFCEVKGHLRHSRGHAQPLMHRMPLPEGNNSMNSAQRAGSGETYAKRYAICAALGIQTGEDDDGNGGQPQGAITADQARDMETLIHDTGTKLADVLKFGGVKQLADFPASKYAEAMRTLQAKARKAQA